MQVGAQLILTVSQTFVVLVMTLYAYGGPELRQGFAFWVALLTVAQVKSFQFTTFSIHIKSLFYLATRKKSNPVGFSAKETGNA